MIKCFGLLVIMFCEQPKPAPPPPSTFCQGYKPVYLSRQDTRETKEQVDRNNRAHERVCPK